MKNNIDDYCRKNRSRSISPSVSFDNPQNIILNEEEKIEKNFYSVTVNEMIKEIFTSFDDLIRNVNHYLVKHIKSAVKGNITDSQWDEVRLNIYKKIFYNFFEVSFKYFLSTYDEAEYKSARLLKMNGFQNDIYEYLVKKNKRKSLEPNENLNDNDNINLYSPLKKFEEEKSYFVKLIRENLRLKIEIALENKISESLSKNYEKIDEKFHFVSNQIDKTPDLTYIDKNIDIMITKMKQMRREVKQLLNN